MDPDLPTSAHRSTVDDATLAALVRDVADDWTLPPQRLDALTWRDRVDRGHRGGRGGGLRWSPRLRIATAAAVTIAMVSLSAAAVWQLASRSDRETAASSPSPAGSPTPAPSAGATAEASPMPKLLRNGDLPTPSRLMTLAGQGYRIADLATGELSDVVIQVGTGPKAVLPRPGGGWVCVCGEGQNVVQLALRTIDANGVVGAPTPLRDIVGEVDPSTPDGLEGFNAGVTARVSPDGRFGLIGWLRRDGAAGWQLGADVLDLELLEMVDSTEFGLDEPLVDEGNMRLRLPPVVRMSPDGSRILVTSQWLIDEMSGQMKAGANHWLASFDGRSIGALADAGSTKSYETADTCQEFDAGLIDREAAPDGAAYYAECWDVDRPITVRRFAPDGRLVSATVLPGVTPNLDETVAAPSGRVLYQWDPFAMVLSRIDLLTGELSAGEPQGSNPTGRTNSNNLLVVSADGTRVYALGIESDSRARDSTGVFAFDASTLAPLGHWAAQADFDSMAVSDDGRFVYAAGSGGPTAAGNPGAEFGASITAYNTSDGSVAVLAGRLGVYDLTLGDPICR
jgi:hypothetical protein